MNLTLDQLKNGIQDYLEALQTQNLAKSTFHVYARNLFYMTEYFEDELHQSEISKQDIVKFKFHVESRYKNATAVNIIGITNRLLHFMELDSFCIKNIKKEHPSRLPDVLSREEYKKLLAVASREDSKLYYIIRTIAGTGINYSDLEFITVDAVIKGHTRAQHNHKSWDIVISRTLQEVLLNYCTNSGLQSGIIFYGKGNNKIIDRAYICRQLKLLGSMVKIPENKLTMRALRLFFSYIYLQNENNIFELNELLGNKMYADKQLLPSRSIAEKSRVLANLKL